jgi:hypothetical protein
MTQRSVWRGGKAKMACGGINQKNVCRQPAARLAYNQLVQQLNKAENKLAAWRKQAWQKQKRTVKIFCSISMASIWRQASGWRKRRNGEKPEMAKNTAQLWRLRRGESGSYRQHICRWWQRGGYQRWRRRRGVAQPGGSWRRHPAKRRLGIRPAALIA